MKTKLLFLVFTFLSFTTLFSQIIANQPSDLEVCDGSGNENYTFDLTVQDAEILGNLDPNNFYVSYHVSEADAAANTNILASPYTNTTNPETIFARVNDVNSSEYAITSFNLIVNTLNIQTFASEMISCGYGEPGFALFDLTVNNLQFTQNQQNLSVSYFETYQNALGNLNAIPNPNGYMNTVPYAQEIYVRVDNVVTGCFVATTNMVLYLNVADSPIPVTLTPLEACDADNDGFGAFNLNDKDAEILALQNSPNTDYLISYHETQADADNSVNALPNTYYNITNPQTVFVRVQDYFGGCYSVSTLNLILDTSCFQIYPAELIACAVGNATGNETATFTLSDANTQILGNLDPNNYSIAYFLNTADAANNANPLPNTYVNSSDPQTVVVRVTDLATDNYELTTLGLNVQPLPTIGFEDSYDICDGESVSLIVGSQTTGAYLAEWSVNGVVVPNYTNFYYIADVAGVYSVTVTETNSGCSTTKSSTVTVGNPLPVNAPVDIVQCNGNAVEYFDLTSQNATILNGLDAATHSISFYMSQDEALLQQNSITDATNYLADVNTTIYIRVENPSGSCHSIFQMQLIMEGCPTIVDCSSGSVNTTFCYDDDNDGSSGTLTTYDFASSDGSPLLIVFNAGQVELSYDELIVYDSNGVNLNANTPYGNSGDLTGLQFITSGDSVSIFVNSDFSINCQSNNYTPIDFDVFCANSIGLIEVNAYLDANNDGIFNGNDTPFSNGYFTYEQNNDGTMNIVNSTTGSFTIASDDVANSYDISFTVNDEYQTCYNVPISVFNAISVAAGNSATVNFPVVEVNACEDIAVYLTESNPPRPGFLYWNNVIIENLGASTTSGSIEFVHDATVTFVEVWNPPATGSITLTATGFIYNFVNLAPGDTISMYADMTVPATTALGTFLTNTVTYITDTNDVVSANNSYSVTQEVVGSYDPNDIMEAQGPEIVHQDFITTDENLYYTIRFQNVGTAEAINVRIENTLNALLDASTLKMLNSSHDVVMQQVDNQLTWTFNGINLPAESQNERQSHGYIIYKIKPVAGYNVGTVIPNTAEIYFDFNAPVITNTFTTTFTAPLSINDYGSNGFALYPNPTKDTVVIRLNNSVTESLTVSVIDIQGKVVLSQLFNSQIETTLNLSQLTSGMYFVKIGNERSQLVEKLIVE